MTLKTSRRGERGGEMRDIDEIVTSRRGERGEK